jgi:plasmid maintenance system killer protein
LKLAYSTAKLRKLATTEKDLIKKFGSQVARAIAIRITTLEATPNLAGIPAAPPTKRHLLQGDRRGQWSIAVRDGVCICVVPDQEPVPENEDGSVALDQVVSVEIVYIGDYHR